LAEGGVCGGQTFGLRLAHNNSLKPTATRVTLFAEKAKPAPRYGGLVPPLYDLDWSMQLRLYQCCSTLTKI